MKKEEYNILIVEDDEGLNRLIQKKLEHEGFRPECVDTGKKAISWFKDKKDPLLLLDYKLSDLSAFDIIEKLNNYNNKYYFVIITGQGDEKIAVDMMKLGAMDYLLKDTNLLDLLPTVINRVINEIDKEKKLRESERALKESEEKFRNLAEQSPNMIFIFGRDKKVLYTNKWCEEILGYSLEELKTICKYSNNAPIKSIEELYNDIEKDIFSRKIKPVEYCIKKKNGEEVDVIVSYRVIIYEGKEAVLCVATDITKRKQAEEELINEKERLDVTVASISDGVIATDIHGNITLINKVAVSLTGYSHKISYGKKISDIFKLINEKTREPYTNPVQRVLEFGEKVEDINNVILIAKDGSEKSIVDSAAPIRDKNGYIIGTVLVFKDVTERRKIEEELQKAHKLESLGVLAGGIAHDFNNILTGILGNVSLAKINLPSDTERYQFLDNAEKAISQAKDLAKQLLTFSKGGVPIRRVVDIRDLINNIVSFYSKGSNIDMKTFFDKKLWLAKVDDSQINQVFNNLIINASQAMPNGGVIKIYVRNKKIQKKKLPLPDGEYIEISVEDEGVGIPKDNLQKIFDPYFTTKQRGYGLGLATCYSIIKKHEGYITADSRLGIGTAFRVYLKAADVKKSKKIIEEKNIVHGTERILIMEDEGEVRNVTANILKQLGYKVEVAIDGDEAIKIYKDYFAQKHQFDVVIMDLTIHGKSDGTKILQKLLKFDPRAKTIVSSGYSNDPVIANYRHYGFKGYIIKPFKIEDISSILRKVIES